MATGRADGLWPQYALGFDTGAQDGDEVIEAHGITVLIDPFSLPYLDGADIDFVDGLNGTAFALSGISFGDVDGGSASEVVSLSVPSGTLAATSGGGVVKVTAKCDGTLAAIKIDPTAVNPADVTLLEDMVLSAANNALTQAKEISNAEMGKVTQGFNLPGMM